MLQHEPDGRSGRKSRPRRVTWIVILILCILTICLAAFVSHTSVKIPKVTEGTLDSARQTLQELGLEVKAEPKESQPTDTVVQQSVPIGEYVCEGFTVILSTNHGDQRPLVDSSSTNDDIPVKNSTPVEDSEDPPPTNFDTSDNPVETKESPTEGTAFETHSPGDAITKVFLTKWNTDCDRTILGATYPVALKLEMYNLVDAVGGGTSNISADVHLPYGGEVEEMLVLRFAVAEKMVGNGSSATIMILTDGVEASPAFQIDSTTVDELVYEVDLTDVKDVVLHLDCLSVDKGLCLGIALEGKPLDEYITPTEGPDLIGPDTADLPNGRDRDILAANVDGEDIIFYLDHAKRDDLSINVYYIAYYPWANGSLQESKDERYQLWMQFDPGLAVGEYNSNSKGSSGGAGFHLYTKKVGEHWQDEYKAKYDLRTLKREGSYTYCITERDENWALYSGSIDVVLENSSSYDVANGAKKTITLTGNFSFSISV